MHARLGAALGLLTFLLSTSASGQPAATELQFALLSVFQDGVVKVEVSTNTPVFQDGRNVCVSEGTGFLISSSYAVTAEHVYNMPRECGEPIILLKSRRHNMQVLATVVDTLNDTALLQIQGPLPEGMCALRVITADVYNVPAFRFGIPGGLQDPSSDFVGIQDQNGDFSPLAALRPAITEPGESGGPVMFRFNVTGITRARHPVHRAISVMTPASNIRELMSRNGMGVEGRVCNPVDRSAFIIDNVNAGSSVKINVPIDPLTRQAVLVDTARLVQGNLGQGSAPIAASVPPVASAYGGSLVISTQGRSRDDVPSFGGLIVVGWDPVLGPICAGPLGPGPCAQVQQYILNQHAQMQGQVQPVLPLPRLGQNHNQITGGPNSEFNNPGQIFGGPNSIFNNPGHLFRNSPSGSDAFDSPHFQVSPNLPSDDQQKAENTARVQQLSWVAASAIEVELWRRLVEEAESRRPPSN